MTLVHAETGEVVASLTPSFDWPAGVHPAADLFPMLPPEDFGKLVADIKANGLLEPIWLDAEGRLLDGRNRLAACQYLNVAPATKVYKGDSPTSHVLSLNIHRRHLSQSQLACVAAEAVPMFEEEAARRMRAGHGDPRATGPQGKATDHAAAVVGASGRTVRRVKRVREADPATFEKVKRGEITAKAGEQKVARDAILSGRPGSKAKKIERISELADQGHTSRQIATQVGLTDEVVRIYAKQAGIEIPADKVAGRLTRIDSNRVVREGLASLEGIVLGFSLAEMNDLDPAHRDEWATSLKNSIRALNKFLKEMTRE